MSPDITDVFLVGSTVAWKHGGLGVGDMCLLLGGGMCGERMVRREAEGPGAWGAPGGWCSPTDGALTPAPPQCGSETLDSVPSAIDWLSPGFTKRGWCGQVAVSCHVGTG